MKKNVFTCIFMQYSFYGYYETENGISISNFFFILQVQAL